MHYVTSLSTGRVYTICYFVLQIDYIYDCYYETIASILLLQ